MRESGILMPVSSLPGKYGIGCFSREAYRFVDQLVQAKQRYWQILPLGPTGHGDSPFQSFSAFAGNPYYISLEDLIEEGVLTEEECDAWEFGDDPAIIDYDKLYKGRYTLLHKAYERSKIGKNPDFIGFQEYNAWWLDDYALFMAVKMKMGGKSWDQWPEDIRRRWWYSLNYYRKELYYDIEFFKYLQYKFQEQWIRLKTYANQRGIRIIGDIPLYVAYDSADTWANTDLFLLDRDNLPVAVAGCPPDGFFEKGQVWGNPLYRWDYHRQTDYRWWMKRLSHCFWMYDVVKIDHFRGFDQYFSIPYGDKTAVNGHWERGPGMDFFYNMRLELGHKEVIAEDLGYMTESLKRLELTAGFPGTKVLEYAFDPRDMDNAEDYLPHNYPINSVVYTGTHDNETLTGWVRSLPEKNRWALRKYLHNFHTPDQELYWDVIYLAMRSASRICIIPLQDYLGLGNRARINEPSTVGKNWKWRLESGQLSKKLLREIAEVTALNGREARY